MVWTQRLMVLFLQMNPSYNGKPRHICANTKLPSLQDVLRANFIHRIETNNSGLGGAMEVHLVSRYHHSNCSETLTAWCKTNVMTSNWRLLHEREFISSPTHSSGNACEASVTLFLSYGVLHAGHFPSPSAISIIWCQHQRHICRSKVKKGTIC